MSPPDAAAGLAFLNVALGVIVMIGVPAIIFAALYDAMKGGRR